MTNHRAQHSEKELLELDARLSGRGGEWWDSFYANRAKPIPFFGTSPDESLHEWVTNGTISRGTALDIGCGNGRNAIFLAQSGFEVEGIDYSQAAIAWTAQRAAEAGVTIKLNHASVFEMDLKGRRYDCIYDSGCFHHIAPHRREGYVALVASALKPGGFFGMACFNPEGGSGLTDTEVYERNTLAGGLGYTEQQLREIWGATFTIRALRQMSAQPTESGLFGESFLWVMLARL
jgi:2-polyprenyl-3-methyl-5-hydroxy-6-metoxy-1,4-benzoquinol methylase